MVFNSIVAELVNRYLGNFIENLDTKQLSIGIWGGEISLKNLFIKENLFDELDLPIKVIYGNIGSLKLTIPWQDIYNQPTVASLDGLYLIAVPNTVIAYNAEKEAKAAWQQKQKELNEIEEAKKKEAMKEKDKKAKEDTFAEKLTANIIKNLEVKITNIHFRYEDNFTNLNTPFSIGVTLKEISLQTTNEKGDIVTIKGNSDIIYKLLKLDSLSVYWNIGQEFYQKLSRPEILERLKGTIAVSSAPLDHKLKDFLYVVQPFTSDANLQLNNKPEVGGFITPKVLLTCIFQVFALVFSKDQYRTLMEFIDAQERMKTAGKYRKYKPKGDVNAKSRWRFCIEATLNDEVRRRRKMWNWKSIKRHRELCRRYKSLYKKKLVAIHAKSRLSATLISELETCEKELDVFNITVVRGQAEIEAKKENLLAPPKSSGWFGGWFGGGVSSEKVEKVQSVEERMEELMTNEEKQKLYDAIGYQENAVTSYPKDYVAVKTSLTLKSLKLRLYEGAAGTSQVLDLHLEQVITQFEQKPASDAIKVLVSMESLMVKGYHQGKHPTKKTPILAQTELIQEGIKMMDVLFETNPQDKSCDTRINITAQPLRITYDAVTVIKLMDFFKPPDYIQLAQIQAAAFVGLERMREQTVAGLQYAIEQQKITEVSITLHPCYIVVPFKGEYRETCQLMVLDLGKLNIGNSNLRTRNLSLTGERSLKELKKKVYDVFDLKINKVSILFVQSEAERAKLMKGRCLSTDGKEEGTACTDDKFILKPMSLNVEFQKCLLEDVKLPRLRLLGCLPSIDFAFSDTCLVDMLVLFLSIPLPQSQGATEEAFAGENKARDTMIREMAAHKRAKNVHKILLSAPSVIREKIVEEDEGVVDDEEVNEEDEDEDDEFKDAQEIPADFKIPKKLVKQISRRTNEKKQQDESNAHLSTSLEIQFDLKQVSLSLLKKTLTKPALPMLRFEASDIGFTMASKPMSNCVTAFIRNLSMQHFNESKEELIHLINTSSESQESLLSVTIDMADKKHPEFSTTFQNTLQNMRVSMGHMHFLLHHQVLCNLIGLSASVQLAMNERLPKNEKKVENKPKVAQLEKQTSRLSLLSSNNGSDKKVLINKNTKDDGVVATKLQINMNSLVVSLAHRNGSLADIKVFGLKVAITIDRAKTRVQTSLTDLNILNQMQETIHNKILFFDGDNVFNADFTMFNPGVDESQVDMLLVFRTGCMNVVFLNSFVQSLLSFVKVFESAKVEEVGAAAAGKATEAAIQMSQKTTKIKLDIEINAPVVRVPCHSNSQHLIIIDLGFLKIHNTFLHPPIQQPPTSHSTHLSILQPITTHPHTLTQQTPLPTVATLDSMTVSLTDVQIYRINQMAGKAKSICDSQIMEPVNISVSVTRNLSASWYHKVPDIQIQGHLEELAVFVDQGDLKTVLLVLSQNLAAPAPTLHAHLSIDQSSSEAQPGSAVDPIDPKSKLTTILETEVEAVGGKPNEQTIKEKAKEFHEELKPQPSDIYTTLKIDFEVKRVQMQLYMCGLNEEVEKDKGGEGDGHYYDKLQQQLHNKPAKQKGVRSTKTPENMLTSVQLVSFRLEGLNSSDFSSSYQVKLFTFQITDSRPEKKDGITNMFSQTDSSADNHMFSLFYKQLSSQEQQVEMSLDHLEFVVCLEFLVKLLQFYNEATVEPAKQTNVQHMTAVSNKQKRPEAIEPPSKPPPPLNLTFTFYKSTVVLIEDASKFDTNCLLLQIMASFAVNNTKMLQSYKGAINDLNIVSCVFNRRNEHTDQILTPCTIEFQSTAPHQDNPHMAVIVSDINLFVSPTSSRIISATLSPLSELNTGKEENSLAKIPPKLWAAKNIDDCDYWFLKKEDSVDLFPFGHFKELCKEEEKEDKDKRREQLIFTSGKVSLTVMGGWGNKTVPLLVTELLINDLEAYDWSTKLQATFDMSIQSAYYNDKLSAWEPIVEPINVADKVLPWCIDVKYKQNTEVKSIDKDDVDGLMIPPLPKASLTLSSTHPLEITITKKLLMIVTELSQSFSEAYSLVASSNTAEQLRAKYSISNNTGLYVSVRLDDTLKLLHGPCHQSVIEVGLKDEGLIQLAHNPNYKRLNTQYSQDPDLSTASEKNDYMNFSFKNLYGKSLDYNVKKCSVFFNEFGESRQVRFGRSEKRAFLFAQSRAGELIQVVCHTKVSYGDRLVALRSTVRVTNNLPVDMEVYYEQDCDVKAFCGTVAAGSTYSLPCSVVATPPHKLFIRPVQEDFKISETALSWKTTTPTTVQCLRPFNAPLCVSVQMKRELVLKEYTHDLTVTTHELILLPGIVFTNLLPIPIIICLEDFKEKHNLKEGESVNIMHFRPQLTYVIISFVQGGHNWSSRQILTDPSMNVWTFESVSESRKIIMDLAVHRDTTKGYTHLSTYSPYWMLNLTGRSLTYKTSDDQLIKQTSKRDEVTFILLKKPTPSAAKHARRALRAKRKENRRISALVSSSFSTFSLHSPSRLSNKSSQSYQRYLQHKSLKCRVLRRGSEAQPIYSLANNVKVCLKVDESGWSDKFSLDTAGSVGTVACKENNANILVGVSISLSSNGLTKIITITPYHIVINQTDLSILFKEHTPLTKWTEMQPKEVLPFWPSNRGTGKQMLVRFKDFMMETKPFDFENQQSTMLKLYHDYAGINVTVNITEGSNTITFQQYVPGCASVLLVNHCFLPVFYKQKNTSSENRLESRQSILYAWDEPTGKRQLSWVLDKDKWNDDELLKDAMGKVKVADKEVYWATFLDGMQRVLLFTDSPDITKNAQQAGMLEQLDMELVLWIQGIGVSLVNNLIGKEIAYLAISSSGVIWEKLKGSRYKPLKTKHCEAIEEAYEALQQNPLNKNKLVRVDEKHHVDFSHGDLIHLVKSQSQKWVIRRNFEPAVWLKYAYSPRCIQLHLKIHNMQMDNQVIGAIFPTVIAIVPLPKSVAYDCALKPLVELSCMIRISPFNTVKQFKYCKLLVQELAVKVDHDFLNSIIAFSTTTNDSDQTQSFVLFKRDLELSKHSLQDEMITSGNDIKNFFDMLHFSPLKIHLSFSLYGGNEDDDENASNQVTVISLFLQSVGVVLTDIQDVVFKLGFFERKFVFYSQTELLSEITQHYSQQAIKQMHVLILGLDVLGNPYGLIRGFAQGIESFFYEPYQGAIQGPEEFVEGIALGFKSIFGHTVGGTAGAVSRITGALGKGIATLTFDDDYQKKRREELNRRPSDIKEGLARGGKGLVMGLVDGVSGVVRKPVEGAKQEGVGGFFKGVGKGLVGVITRPASGVVDFASSSFDGIRRAAEQSEEVKKLRPARVITSDRVVRPYQRYQAEGCQVLQELAKGEYLSDVYIGHVNVLADGGTIFIATDKRVLFASKGDLLGHWNFDWTYVWTDLKEPPILTSKGIQIILKEREKKLMGSWSVGKMVNVQNIDASYMQTLVKKMKAAFNSSNSS